MTNTIRAKAFLEWDILGFSETAETGNESLLCRCGNESGVQAGDADEYLGLGKRRSGRGLVGRLIGQSR